MNVNDAAGMMRAPGACRRFRSTVVSDTIVRTHPGTRAASSARMHAYVYKSRKRADTYVYLAEREDFARLPDTLRAQLGPLDFLLEVALTPERRLARGNQREVMKSLETQGFHLQLPTTLAADPMSEDWGTDA